MSPRSADRPSLYIRLLSLVGRIGTRLFTRVSLVGRLEALPGEGPLIVAANHLSNADGVVLAGWLTPALDRAIHWLGKREMTEWPVLGRFVLAYSVHPVDRAGADIEAFRVAERVLRDGHVLLLFPEGTRSPTGGLQRPREGLALLALRTGAPILPVGIAGTQRVWPRGRKPRRDGPITITVGEPFRVADAIGPTADRREAKVAATDAIMRRIAELLPPELRGVYADPIRSEPTGEPDATGSVGEPGPVDG